MALKSIHTVKNSAAAQLARFRGNALFFPLKSIMSVFWWKIQNVYGRWVKNPIKHI
jgi:hypothetical protein